MDKAKFINTEQNLGVFNFEYSGNKYQVTIPFEEIDAKNIAERESPNLHMWGDKVNEAIKAMESQNLDIKEFYFLLSTDGRIRGKDPIQMRFFSPLSKEEPLLFTYWLEISPKSQNLGRLSLRVRGVVKKVDKQFVDNGNTPAKM